MPTSLQCPAFHAGSPSPGRLRRALFRARSARRSLDGRACRAESEEQEWLFRLDAHNALWHSET